METNKLLGILATKANRQPATAQNPFPGRSGSFRQIAKIAHKKGLQVCVFSPRSVNRAKNLVNAFVYTPGRGWVKRVCPLPSVVYNRVANRRAEGRGRVQNLLAWLEKQNVTVFNPRFLDKWEVCAALAADESTRPYLPPTELYEEPKQLVRLIQSWRYVYCKPRRGSLGKGIASLSLLPSGKVRVQRNITSGPTKHTTLARIEDVSSWARNRLVAKRICLQKGVNLVTYKRRRFDLRVLVQKNAAGKWCFTGAAARAAAHGQVTTHVPRGGIRLPLERALQGALGNKEKASEVAKNLEVVSEMAGSVLDKNLKGTYGEFSLDVGVDRNGNLWIFEMNAKPFRFDEPLIRHRSYQCLVEFAASLLPKE